MDQVKNGRFIAKLRKEKNLTQVQLANTLGVSDRTISKWENGRGMPDISILKSLSDALDISINELLSGERLNSENIQGKSEENIIHTIEESSRKLKTKDRIIKITVGLMVVLVVSMILMFCYEHRIVSSPDLSDILIEREIEEYFFQKEDMDKKFPYEVCFVAAHLFDFKYINETEIAAYVWIRIDKVSRQEEIIVDEGGSSCPYKVTLQKSGDEYKVLKTEYPQSGQGIYKKDMETLFPKGILKEMEKANQDGTLEKLELDIQKQIEIYYRK